MTDREWVQLYANDAEQTLRALLSQYHGVATAVARRVLPGRPQDAEECVNDAFFSIWKQGARFDPARGSLLSLIVCAVRSRALDRYRKLRREHHLNVDELELESEFDLQADFFRKECAAQVKAAVHELREPDRSILMRRYWLLESVREIAAALGLSPKQVENRLYSAKLRLRDILKEEGETA